MPGVIERDPYEGWTVTSFKQPAARNGFGVKVDAPIDLNDLSEPDFKKLEYLVYKHRVVVLKGQKQLRPAKQQELGYRLDPKSPAFQAHGEDVRKKPTVLGSGDKSERPVMPEAPLLVINGSGDFKAGHYGVPHDFTLVGLNHRGFQRDELSHEQVENGESRFQRWHMDAPFYNNWPCRITTLWAHKMPKDQTPVTVKWTCFDQEYSMDVRPGQTCFFDSVALYNSLSPETKRWVDNSLVEYKPSPYAWLRGAKAQSNGLTMFSEGKEAGDAAVADEDPAGAQTIPLVWVNPVTGEKAFQVHLIVAAIHYRESPDEEFKIIDDIVEVRRMIDEIQLPWLKPENILVGDAEDGDMIFFYNRGVRHSAVEFASNRGDRLLHQLQMIAAKDDPPFAPARIEGQPYYLDVQA